MKWIHLLVSQTEQAKVNSTIHSIGQQKRMGIELLRCMSLPYHSGPPIYPMIMLWIDSTLWRILPRGISWSWMRVYWLGWMAWGLQAAWRWFSSVFRNLAPSVRNLIVTHFPVKFTSWCLWLFYCHFFCLQLNIIFYSACSTPSLA